jgi:hypothetical protein
MVLNTFYCNARPWRQPSSQHMWDIGVGVGGREEGGEEREEMVWGRGGSHDRGRG